MNDELTNGAQDSTRPEVATHKVQIFRAGPLQFGVAEEQVAAIAPWRVPTPLPHAPESVMGVVSIQGRMLTVLDLTRLFGSDQAPDESYRHTIALRGDEQLALAASALDESIVSASDSGDGTNGNDRFVRCVFTHSGADTRLLNISELFAAALQGRERRRRRF